MPKSFRNGRTLGCLSLKLLDEILFLLKAVEGNLRTRDSS